MFNWGFIRSSDLVTPDNNIVYSDLDNSFVVFCCKTTNVYISIVMMVILNDDGVTGKRL